MQQSLVGSHFGDFDFHLVLSHFKGHQMGGFGGALKNVAIGYASAEGKGLIHRGGDKKVKSIWGGGQDAFLESMAEAVKSVVDVVGNKIVFINVMNHLSIDCDCSSNPSAPTMADIGILASLDPVALDQACVDLVKNAPDGNDLLKRIQSRNALLTIDHAEKIGVGSKKYELVRK
jgi:uncharacterized Fe-S center protein